MKKNNKGFTLAELLIVVAIIAVLVAVAIPVFTTQLEKARDSTDQANIRSAYAELSAALVANTNAAATKADLGLTSDLWDGSLANNAGTFTYTFVGKGTNTAWDNTGADFKIGDITIGAKASATTITFTVTAGKISAIALN